MSLALASAVLGGCAVSRPAPYKELASSGRLSPNLNDRSGRAPYSFSKPVDWTSRYHSVLIDPVVIYRGADQQFEKISDADKRELATYMRDQFSARLSENYKQVEQPGPGVLRVSLTLTGAKTTKAVIGALAHFDLAGGSYNAVQAARGREAALTGWVMYAVELHDAASGELLGAEIVKQYPNAMNIKASVGALSAAKAGVRKGADDLNQRLSGRRS
ncbi:DUF3313 domain-containing protein [Caulobacter sp. BP25]|uniref:DUF3313 domain-containing protein n=1 Tax=Caulobacter sp. BP25 TaxID=2048900 RepID=UPI00191BB118|nr:DUF3313 domain-containing protein [Caulobacter sp. BP25]